MLMNLLYDHGLLVTAIVILAVTIIPSLFGLWIVRRLVPLEHRRSHNDVIGFSAATVGMIYAVLLAFIAVAVWESFNKAGDVVSQEASLTGDLYRDIAALPLAARKPIAEPLRAYVDTAIDEEWPTMSRGEEPGPKGWELLEQVHDRLGKIETVNPVQVVVVQEMISRLNTLYDARRDRLDAASGDTLHPAVWSVMVIGGLFTVGFCWLLGFERNYLHILSVTLVAASLGLIVFLIVSFDFPFRGELQIGSDAFGAVKENMERLSKTLEGG